jgi:hypothetical protein
MLLLAIASFVQVFMLGFQSRSVNAGNYLYAFVCSTAIGFSQVLVWKHIMEDTQSLLATAVYAFSGACAICSAIYVHKRVHKEKKHD